MCTSKPKIPDNKTPPVPLPPEASPDAPQIGSRYQDLRARGLSIPARPDLSGLGNQDVGTPISRLQIGAGSAPYDPVAETARLQAENERLLIQPSNTRPSVGGRPGNGSSANRR